MDSKMTFEDAVDILLAPDIEGGFADSPSDLGGRTKFGISQRAYPHVDIKNLTRLEAEYLYKRDYWAEVNADQLPPELRLPVFDAAVNQGVRAAGQMLQALVGAVVDGHVGPHTLGSVRSYVALRGVNELVLRFSLARIERYGNLARSRKSQRKNLLHWTYRTIKTCEESIS